LALPADDVWATIGVSGHPRHTREERVMKVLVLNCGSSSVKFQLIDPARKAPLARGLIERVGTRNALLTYGTKGKSEVKEVLEVLNHDAAIRLALSALLHQEYGAIGDQSEIGAIGHRVVHAGEAYQDSVLITEDVIETIRSCAKFAPLHNPHNLRGIEVAGELLPGVPQVAVFDTAFHQRMPREAYTYALPLSAYTKLGIRRYGFHGTSHRYVSSVAAKKVGRPLEELKIVTCHLGNGASVAAVKGGASVETSMGFTPLEGLVMGTRTGDIDPAIIPYMMEREGLTVGEVNTILNKESGLLGLSGVSGDVRELLEEAEQGNTNAALAIDVFCHRARKYVGSYAAVMGGLDVLVFTGGIGENSPYIRERICEGLDFLGVTISDAKNARTAGSIGAGDTHVLVIHTNEELAIAQDVRRVLSGAKRPADVGSAGRDDEGLGEDGRLQLLSLWARRPGTDASHLASDLSEMLGREIAADSVAAELRRLGVTAGGAEAIVPPAGGRPRISPAAIEEPESPSVIDPNETGWIIARCWLTAMEQTARDFHGRRPHFFTYRAYEHSTQSWLRILESEYGIKPREASTISEAVESYIEVGAMTGLFKDASQFEVREITPNRVEISTLTCPYVHVCKDLLDQGASLGALTCARLGCFNAAVKALTGIETTYEVLGVHLLEGCEGVIERK
jgi:acetate kinase